MDVLLRILSSVILSCRCGCSLPLLRSVSDCSSQIRRLSPAWSGCLHPLCTTPPISALVLHILTCPPPRFPSHACHPQLPFPRLFSFPVVTMEDMYPDSERHPLARSQGSISSEPCHPFGPHNCLSQTRSGAFQSKPTSSVTFCLVPSHPFPLNSSSSSHHAV